VVQIGGDARDQDGSEQPERQWGVDRARRISIKRAVARNKRLNSIVVPETSDAPVYDRFAGRLCKKSVCSRAKSDDA